MFDSILQILAHGILDWPLWKIVVAVLAMTHLTIAGVTIYLHRHQAHRALDLHPLPSHIFRLWLWLTTGMQTREWAAIHRKHHAKCETEEDPHSPQTRGINTVMWRGAELYRSESKNAETIEKYGRGTPDDWIEHHVYSRFPWQGCGVMLVSNWLLFGLGIGTVVWTIQMMWIPFWAAGVINGIGHYWGYRNFDCEDASRNVFPWGIIIGGEELHNNHHTYATSARLSNKWYEFDIGWMYICILSFFKLAHVKKVAPKPKFALPQPLVDLNLDNLQAVITHRYDVMAKYAQSLKAAHREEVARLKATADQKAASKLENIKLENIKLVRKLLHKDAETLSEANRSAVSSALAHSPALQKIYEMRTELQAIWERSSATREQLLADLQDWCRRAEESGVRTLQDFSLRLRSYA